MGFARKKNADLDTDTLHPSWLDHMDTGGVSIRCGSVISVSSDEEDSLLKELNHALETDTESWEDTGDYKEDSDHKETEEKVLVQFTMGKYSVFMLVNGNEVNLT